MKKRNVLAAFAVCLILFQMNLFSEEQAKNVMTYSFASKELAGFQLKISPVPVDKTQYHDNVKKIQIVKDDVVEAEYTTLHILQNNLGEGFIDIELLSDGFIVRQTFREGRGYLVSSALAIKYEHNKFLLKEYREDVTNVFWERQDFEHATVSLEKGIPFEYVSDDLIYILHSYLMFVELRFFE